VPQRRHPDPLFRISYGIFSVKFVIVELTFFGLGLFGLYKLVQEETGFSFQRSTTEISKPTSSP
jgi:hypothetical protein